MSVVTDPLLTGRCACGDTTWTSTHPPSHLDFCYCTTCRRVTGAPFGAWLGLKKNGLTWDGFIAKYRVSDLATRSLCVQCGSSLAIQYDCYPEKTHVGAGTVEKGAELVPKVGLHLFVAEKPVWYVIPEDGVPREDGFDEQFLSVLKRHNEAEKPETGLKVKS